MGVVTDIRTFASALIERSALAKQLGYTFSGKRRIYEVLGYDETITARQYRERYARGGIAGRVVDALAKATWRGEGIIFEDEDPKKETTFEAAWKALNDQLKVWSTLQRAHIQASLGSFSVLLLGAPGDFTTELPRGKPGGLLYMTPFGGGVIDLTQMRGQSSGVGADVQVSTWEEDSANPRFGQPLSYQLRRTNLTSPELQRPVHWTRVVHIPAPGFLDDAIFGPPGLEGVWNYLDDLDKVVGGGAEAFWMRANAGQQWDIDKKTTIPTDPKDKQAELDRLKDQAEAYEHQMSRIIRTRGVNINQLGSDVADFKNPSDALLTLIAGTTGIPKRILTGSEMGELASSQDRDNWNDQVKDCRTAYAHPVILRPFIERLIEYGYLPPSTQWEVEWPDIESMSEDEKLDTAKKAQSLNAAGEIVITGAELRETYLEKDPLSEEDLIVEPWRADLALKMAETNKSQGAVVFTDDEIRKTCYGWEPLKPEEKVPLTAPERVSATAPTPSVDAQGHPIQAKPQALPRPGLPRSGPIPALRAAELGQALEALEAAIEAEDLEAVGQIVGLAWDEDLHPRDDHGRFGPGSRSEFLAAPKDALDSIAAGDHVTIAKNNLYEVITRAHEGQVHADLTKLTLEGTPIFAGGMNLERIQMPQISKDAQPGFLNALKEQGIKTKEENVSPMSLIATQNEISAFRVGEKLREFESGKKDLRPILISKDNRVLDGHHRWAVGVTLQTETSGVRIPAVRIMQSGRKALDTMNRYARDKGLVNKALACGELMVLGGPGSGWTAENGHVPNAEARVGQIVAKSKYGEIKVSKSLGGDIKYVAYRKNGEGVGSFKTVNSAKEALRKPTNTESFPSGYMSPDVAWKHLGDKPGHEFHGNQWKSGVSSSHIEKLETGGSFKQTFANESKVVNALHDVNDALKKAGWINNDWTPGEGGSDTGHGASYQYEKKGMTAIVTRHHLSLHLGSHQTDD